MMGHQNFCNKPQFYVGEEIEIDREILKEKADLAQEIVIIRGFTRPAFIKELKHDPVNSTDYAFVHFPFQKSVSSINEPIRAIEDQLLIIPVKYLRHKDNQTAVKTRNINPRRIIYNNPATIVFWDDGTKTVVKCAKEEDHYSKYNAFCAALAIKIFESNSRVHKIVQKGEDQTLKHLPKGKKKK